MIIYNVTIQVEKPVAEKWLRWLKEEHIPEVMQTGCFIKYQVVKLLDTDETESLTYAAQYYAENKSMLDRYLQDFAGELRQKGIDAWGDRFIAFRTVMEIVQ
ncbi:MAG TPA: DUF4286 family protein [Chitinophagaceae bacterium]